MSKLRKLSFALVAATLLAVMLAGLAGLDSGPGGIDPAQAQANPPARFAGSVKLDGQNVPNGTVVEAKVGGVSCADPVITFSSGGESRYVIDVLAAGQAAGCGASGSTVSFFIGGKLAQQTGVFNSTQLNVLNLTAVSASPTVAASPTTAATPTKTPGPPSTGEGLTSPGDGSNSGLVLLMALGLGALALGAGGIAVARRTR